MVRTLVHTTLRLRNHQADEHQSSRYYRYAFTLPESCGKLTLSMETNTRQSAQVPLILFDPLGQVRLMRAANATTGPARTTYTIMPSSADNGCIPGALPAGTWKLLLYKRRMLEDVDATITVTWEPAQDLPPETQQECPVVTALREHPFSQACPGVFLISGRLSGRFPLASPAGAQRRPTPPAASKRGGFRRLWPCQRPWSDPMAKSPGG